MHLVSAAVNNFLMAKLFVTIILIASGPGSVTSWSNVKKLSVSDEASCISACTEDSQCSRWSFYPASEILPSVGTVGDLCFLESKVATSLERNLHHSSPGTQDKTTGLKRLSGDRGFVGVQNLLAGPLEFDSTTVLNFPQHFVRGCSYTISVWVWMWRPRLINSRIGQDRKESILFSTMDLKPDELSTDDESWLPSIIYNVPSKPGKFFFSANRDDYGDYSGFSPPYDIRYHEWIHVAMTISDDNINSYINGKLLSSNRASFSRKRRSGKCPYFIVDSADKLGDVIDDKNNTSTSRIQRNQLHPNTIMDVIGTHGRLSDPGMMQDLTVVRGLALSEAHIQEQMNARRPSIPPTMKKLMQLFDIHTLEGYTELPWFDNYYRMKEWRLCPTQVCGPICLTDKFLLGLHGFEGTEDSENNNSNYEDFDELLDDFYQTEYGDNNEMDGGESTDADQNFKEGSSSENQQDGMGNVEDELGVGYDDYYDENGLLKPLTPDQQEIWSSYGYDTHDDYYGDSDGQEDGYYGEGGGGGGVGVGGGGIAIRSGVGGGTRGIGGEGGGGIGGGGGGGRMGGGRGGGRGSGIGGGVDAFGDGEDGQSMHAHPRQIGRRPMEARSSKMGSVKVHVKNIGSDADTPEKKSSSTTVKKSTVPKTSKINTKSSVHDSKNSTYISRTVITLPRRHSFKKMSMVNSNHKLPVNAKKTPVPLGHVGWVFSEQFGFMDHITPAAVMKYVSNAYKNFAPINGEQVNKEKIVDDSEDEKKKIEEMKMMSIEKLAALDEKEEAYLLHHPVGKIQALYDAAMIWLNGRHAEFNEDMPSNSAFKEDMEGSWVQYRRRGVERATSALTLAMWLADDQSNDPSEDGLYASELSLTIHIALGYLKANGGGVAVKGQDRAEEVLWSALGGQSLSTLLSSTGGECTGPDDVSDKCLRPPKGDPSSTPTGPKGIASSTPTSPMGHTDLEWHMWASAQDSDSHSLSSTDIDDDGNAVDWVVNHREPSGSSGQKGRLTNGEFSHVSALLKNFADVSSAYTVEDAGDEGSTVGVYGRAAEGPSDRSIQQRKTRDRDDYLTSSALYYPVARSMMAQQDFAVLNIYMQVLDELVFLWREEQGELTILRNGGWVVGKNPSKKDDPEKQAEDGYYQEIVGENKEDRLKRKLSEANKGNVQSQSWMGMHFYSESNGNEHVITEARMWFEKAAAQVDAVSNYFMGVLHFNRLGGLKRDFEKESEYFLRAVGSFPMAWHALGDLHDSRYRANKRRGELRNEWYDDADLLIALEYYLTAAEYNVHESHFCLSNIYKTGSPSIPKNIPQALVHLTQAASLDNMKAVSHLAEAFYDEDSWLLEYLRTTAPTKTHYQPLTDPQNNPTIKVESTDQSFIPLSYSSKGLSGLMERLIVELAVHVKEKIWRLIHYLLLEGIEPDDTPYNPSKSAFVHSKRDAVTALAIRQKWVFNATVPLFVTLPGIMNHILVPLPHPLWPTSDAEHYMLSDAPPLIPTQQPYKKRCLSDQTLNLDSCIPMGAAQDSNGVTTKEVASALFKYVAEQSHALFVLNEAATAAMDAGSVWDALDLYEEAADLGSQFAEDSSIFLYDNLLLSECSAGGTKGNDIGGSKGLQSWKATRSVSPGTAPAAAPAPAPVPGTGTSTGTSTSTYPSPVTASDESSKTAERDGTFSSKQYVLSGNASTHDTEAAKCRAYLKHMSRVRLLHLSNGGNHFAARMMADNMIEDSPTTFKMLDPPSVSKIITYLSGLYAAVKRYFIKTFLSPSESSTGGSGDEDCMGSHSNASVKSPVDLKGAARLYSIAASHGDTRSLMSLGWIFTASKGGILKNLDASFYMFTNAQQWESFLPSIFSPFTPTAKAPQTYPVKEFFYLSADVVIEKYLYWENTIGIAPYFALIYLKFIQNFPESSDDLKGSAPSVLAVIVENMKYHSSLCWDRLQHIVSPLKSVLSDAEMNALSLLTTLFLAVLLALYFRSHNRIRQPH